MLIWDRVFYISLHLFTLWYAYEPFHLPMNLCDYPYDQSVSKPTVVMYSEDDVLVRFLKFNSLAFTVHTSMLNGKWPLPVVVNSRVWKCSCFLDIWKARSYVLVK